MAVSNGYMIVAITLLVFGIVMFMGLYYHSDDSVLTNPEDEWYLYDRIMGDICNNVKDDLTRREKRMLKREVRLLLRDYGGEVSERQYARFSRIARRKIYSEGDCDHEAEPADVVSPPPAATPSTPPAATPSPPRRDAVRRPRRDAVRRPAETQFAASCGDSVAAPQRRSSPPPVETPSPPPQRRSSPPPVETPSTPPQRLRRRLPQQLRRRLLWRLRRRLLWSRRRLLWETPRRLPQNTCNRL